MLQLAPSRETHQIAMTATLPLRPIRFFLTVIVLSLLLVACGNNAEPTPAPAIAPTEAPTVAPTELPTDVPAPTDAPNDPNTDTPITAGMATPTPDGRVPAYGYTVINTYPHDPTAYTQGLQYVDGVLYEGTGRHGASSLRRVELETGEVLQQHDLAEQYFGEGIVVIEDEIYQLTWQEHTAFLYDRESFEEKQQFTYETEGWGLTFDGTHLIMSDGSSNLFFRDPVTFEEVRRVPVTYLGAPLTLLNELEYIDDEVWANVYQTNFIVRINPETGVVQGVVDLTGLLDTVDHPDPTDVLNGIAWDAENQRLFVTGKWWPALFEITIQQIGWAQ